MNSTIPTPVCQPSLISYQGPADTQPSLYSSHPFSQTSRANGTILASDDSGRTFHRQLNLGIRTAFGYSSLACGLQGGSDDCAVLYDAGGVLRIVTFRSADVV